MSTKPNNFPREGEHNTVTKAALDHLESNRAKHNSDLDYTIGGTVETIVHTTVEGDRNYALNAGYRRLNEVSQKVQSDHVFAANKGRPKAQFQARNDTGPTYAEMQREAVRNVPVAKEQLPQQQPNTEPQRASAPTSAPVTDQGPKAQPHRPVPNSSYAEQQRQAAAPVPNKEPCR